MSEVTEAIAILQTTCPFSLTRSPFLAMIKRLSQIPMTTLLCDKWMRVSYLPAFEMA